MKGHKFISQGVEEFFDSSAFVETSLKGCFVCGALFESVRINYLGEFTYPSDMSWCSGDSSAHDVEGVVESGCSCLLCEG